MAGTVDKDGAKASPTIAPPPEAKSGVTIEAGAGKAEAALLMVGAMRAAAETIATATLTALDAALPPEIILFAGGETVDLAPLDRFEMAFAQLTAQLQAALTEPRAAPRPGGDRGLASAVIAAVPALNIATSLLTVAATAAQYFAVKTRFAGIELGGQDVLLRCELAAVLLARRTTMAVRLAPLHDSAASTAILTELQALGDLGSAATAMADALDTSTAAVAMRAAALRNAAKAETDFRALLMLADKDSAAALAELTMLRGVRDALDRGAALVFVTAALAGGGQFSRHGLFGGIFRDPTSEVFAMVVVSYTVLVGRSLQLIATGNVRAPTRYVALHDVAAMTDDTVLTVASRVVGAV